MATVSEILMGMSAWPAKLGRNSPTASVSSRDSNDRQDVARIVSSYRRSFAICPIRAAHPLIPPWPLTNALIDFVPTLERLRHPQRPRPLAPGFAVDLVRGRSAANNHGKRLDTHGGGVALEFHAKAADFQARRSRFHFLTTLWTAARYPYTASRSNKVNQGRKTLT